jgi:ABC-type dipeptide/oligopeptide/nickel transport system ATPase component
MRQRAMIAMALSCDPVLLIADEPTTALDVTIEAQILNLLRDIQEERGMSIMLITHDLSVIGEMAERVMVMYMGKLVERASCDELFYSKSRHPYTEALLKSIPKIGTRDRLRPISRTPSPSPMAAHFTRDAPTR